MKFLFLSLFSLITAVCLTQVPAIEWKKCYGGPQDETAHTVIETNTGDFIIGGSAQSNAGDITGHHGSTSFYDYWILNTDNAGTINWQKSYGGSADDVLYAIQQTTDNGYIVAGYTFSVNGNVTGNNGNSDQWIAKLSPSGSLVWKTCLGGSAIDYATDIKQTADSGYIVAGSTYSSDSDVTMSYGGGDYWLLKLDATGNIIWQKTFGGSGYDYCLSVANTSDGGFIMSGYTNSNDHDITFNHGDYDTWIVKTDASGIMEWQKCYGGSNTDYNNAIIETGDGDFFVTGSSLSNNGDVSGCHAPNTFHDYWVFIISSTGELTWQKCFGGFNGDNATNAIQTPDKGFIITGYSASTDGDVTGHHGIMYNNDIWTFKINSTGDIEWEKSFGGSGNDAGMDLIQTSEGGYLIAGQTESTDGDVTGNHGGTDYWLIKLACTSSVFYADADEDGYGDISDSVEACLLPAGYVPDHTDCNDMNNLIHPFATELCNSTDDDCNGLEDDGILFTVYYVDADADGFGDLTSDSSACILPVGYVLDFTDCNDANSEINPAAIETCNASDDNCNGLIDDDIVFTYYFADMDGDGFGDPFTDSLSCITPAGYIFDFSDCNDTDASINPAAAEICNALDDNCNASIDDGILFIHYYPDMDGDGFGDPAIDVFACAIPTGYVSDFTDCDDTNNAIFPGASELCNLTDDNCNLLIDDGLSYTTFFMDADDDTFGNALIDTIWCDAVDGYIADSTDCNDNNPLIHPGATEILNGLDDNCNQLIDEGLTAVNMSNAIGGISVSPNPASAYLIIHSDVSCNKLFRIINATGQVVLSTKTSGLDTFVDLNTFSPGIYFLIPEDNDISAGIKFIKL